MAVTILVMPLAVLIHRSAAKKADGSHFGSGVRVIQLIGAGTLLPSIVILALEGLIDGAAVAALVGAFVGYLFSNIADFDRRRGQGGGDRAE